MMRGFFLFKDKQKQISMNKQIILKNSILPALAVCALLAAGCADHYDGDETWSPQVKNATLTSPEAGKITITSSADGSTMTIAWPVVYGAGGYAVELYNVNDPNSPVLVKTDTIDGCSLRVDREEDTNYSLTIRTLGNQKYNNREAQESSELKFNTFLPTYAEIPDGSDLKTWFAENPIPADSTSHLCYDLVPGGSYTVSGKIDFDGHQVTLRSSSKANYANVVMEAGSYFNTYAGFTLKYLNINAEATNKPLISFSDEPDESIKNLIGEKGCYFIMDPVVVQGCNITKLGSSIVASNSAKYDVRVVSINNTVVELDKTLPAANSAAVIYMKSGFISDFTIKNSTVYSREHCDVFFIQHGGRPKDVSDEEQRYVSVLNCTLCNIAYGKNFCDYHNGQTTYHYTLKNTIVVDCGKTNFLTGLNKGQSSDNPVWDVNNNTCWRDGSDASASQTGIKNPGLWLTTDPGIDPANAKFVPAAAQQEAGQGDPRWIED
jgi:hypothetical protein